MAQQINLVSAEELIGEFLFDFDVRPANYMSSLNRHIIRGIEIMNIDTYFKRCTKIVEVQDGSIKLPCNAKYLELVVIEGCGNVQVLDLSQNNLALVGQLPNNINSYSEAYAEDEHIHTGLNGDGRALIIYRTLPKNGKGYVMLPDDALLKEALGMFLIAKLALSGYKHKVVSREEAEQKWAYLYPKARNSVNFPSVHDMQQFTNMWNNPLKGDWYNNLFAE